MIERVCCKNLATNVLFYKINSFFFCFKQRWDYSDVFVQQESKLETDVISQAKDNSSKKLNIRNETILEEQWVKKMCHVGTKN